MVLLIVQFLSPQVVQLRNVAHHLGIYDPLVHGLCQLYTHNKQR